MKDFLSLGMLLIMFVGFAQNNAFLNRGYWSTNTSVADVQKTIAEGNDPTERNAGGFDATVLAINSKAPMETIKYLLSIEGNPVDKMTHDGRNYLMWASFQGNYELVQYLISQGSDVRWKDDKGNDIITYTATGGNTDPKLYELYKSHGFVLKNSTRNGANALLLAAPSISDLQELKYFIDNDMQLADVDEQGNNVFHMVATKGNTTVMQQLMNAGIDAHAVNKVVENALFMAAKGARGHSNGLEVFQFLAEQKINPLQKDSQGNTLMHVLAMRNSDWSIFEYFATLGLDMNSLNHNNETPYLLALKNNNEKVLNALYAVNKDFALSTKDGHTALSYAVMSHNAEQVQKLIDSKQNLMVTNQDGATLMQLLIENYNPRKSKEFERIFAILSDANVGVSPTQNNGNNLYHTVVVKNHVNLISYLKSLNLDINQRNDEGLTPLHLAAMKATDLNTIKTLLQNGADPKIKTEFGEDITELVMENELLDVSENDLKSLTLVNKL
ncbi:MAG: ankyrin repeat domain-containing protein [Weeksellaceae bacterium]|nr:ankyrin repeat domain-containing protein [Weeksellaceae bacterium]